MRQRIKNKLYITLEGDVDLTGATGLEFYVRQNTFFRTYTPEVLSSTELAVDVPYEDAMQLAARTVKLQLAFTDALGQPQATEPAEVPVGVLLKEVGYDPS